MKKVIVIFLLFTTTVLCRSRDTKMKQVLRNLKRSEKKVYNTCATKNKCHTYRSIWQKRHCHEKCLARHRPRAYPRIATFPDLHHLEH